MHGIYKDKQRERNSKGEAENTKAKIRSVTN